MYDDMLTVIESHGDFAHGGDPEGTAEDWEAYDISPREADEFLDARTFEPSVAADLLEEGYGHLDAAEEVDIGSGDYSDTLGYKVSNGDLSLDDAIEYLEGRD